MEVKQLSWKPRRHGDVYCSPACGGGCTRKKYNQAVSKSKKLAKTLGSGWKADVWENLGWHYCVVNGGMKVHDYGDYYRAFLGEPDSAGGRWSAKGKTPKIAINNVIRQAQAQTEELQRIIDEWIPRNL